MTRTLTIFKKEFTDTIRDKRTLITMIVVPLALIPLLIGLITKLGQRMVAKAEAEKSTVAFIGGEYAPELRERIVDDTLFIVVPDIAESDLDTLIRSDSLDGAIVVPASFGDLVSADLRASLSIHFRSSNQLNVTERRMRDAIDAYDDDIVSGRIRARDLDEEIFDAIEIVRVDIASLQEVLGKTVGGFLPYLFILLAFTGCMYPGIDLGAGEKERGTLETVLSSPASRLEIVLGKFFVVALIGLSSALLSMVGLYLGVRMTADIPPQILEVVWRILNVKVVLMIASLLVPLTAFLAAVILGLSIHSKSFKEAQSTLTPLSIVVIVPVAVGLMPGIELSVTTALIPVLNVSLATKEVIAGTIQPLHLTLSYLSLFVLASAGIAFCVKWFNREETLFRT
jgi:sodium transport system permease protein